jgi:hypothetical protein
LTPAVRRTPVSGVGCRARPLAAVLVSNPPVSTAKLSWLLMGQG